MSAFFSTRFEFFNVRRSERRIYEKYPANVHALKTFQEADGSDDLHSKSSSKELKVLNRDSSESSLYNFRLQDSRNGRFWRQLSRRRTIEKTTNLA